MCQTGAAHSGTQTVARRNPVTASAEIEAESRPALAEHRPEQKALEANLPRRPIKDTGSDNRNVAAIPATPPRRTESKPTTSPPAAKERQLTNRPPPVKEADRGSPPIDRQVQSVTPDQPATPVQPLPPFRPAPARQIVNLNARPSAKPSEKAPAAVHQDKGALLKTIKFMLDVAVTDENRLPNFSKDIPSRIDRLHVVLFQRHPTKDELNDQVQLKAKIVAVIKNIAGDEFPTIKLPKFLQ